MNGGPETTFLPPEEIEKIFESKGIHTDERVIASCGTGVTAASNSYLPIDLTILVLVVGLHHAGKTNYSLYDGSWTEYSRTLK